jgi:hypothetical protein
VVVVLEQISLVQMVVLAVVVQDQQPAALVELLLVLIRMPAALDKVTVGNRFVAVAVAALVALVLPVLLPETAALENC